MNKIALTAAVAALATLGYSQSMVVRLDLDGDLTDTFGGPDAEGITNNGLDATSIDFETVTIDGQETMAAKLPDGNALAAGKGLKVYNPIGANGTGTRTNQFTFVLDIKFEGLDETYHGLYQADATNGSDGDWFGRTGSGGVPTNKVGTGISGDYVDGGNENYISPGEWHRLALVIDAGETDMYRTYVDGALQNIVQSPADWTVDGQFTLGDFFYLNVDNNPEAYDTAYWADFALYDYALSDDEIAGLGAATATGVPEPATMIALGAGLAALAARRRKK